MRAMVLDEPKRAAAVARCAKAEAGQGTIARARQHLRGLPH